MIGVSPSQMVPLHQQRLRWNTLRLWNNHSINLFSTLGKKNKIDGLLFKVFSEFSKYNMSRQPREILRTVLAEKKK